MAVTIPIISEFDGKGISRAVAEFKQLEGAGAKAQFALKKAAIPAAAAIGGLRQSQIIRWLAKPTSRSLKHLLKKP